MKSNNRILITVLLSCALMVGTSFLFVGCKTPTLAPNGAYNITTTNAVTGAVTSNPDIAFYAVDSAFDLAYQTIDGIFLFEQKNRNALWAISPDIKHGLDKARPVAADIVRRYTAARAAYIANPSPGQLTSLQDILKEINTLSATAQAALPKQTP